jgi:two-component system chemotaxis sensor kinase CheA
VVEKITDPLTHLVRNSIDHGIENKQQRVSSGKSEEATLQLNAYHDSGSIVIEVADDGKGLDRDKIRNTAIKRGLISSNATLTDEEVEALIFEPGFSTAESVTNLSGRGVGMDVVRQNIQSLRGTIEIESSPGVGTVSRIRLPLTLAIIDGFLVSVGNDSYVIPLSMIVECVELRKGDIETNQGRNYVNLRGEVLPFVRIREVFETNTDLPARENIVVVNYAGRAAGLVVDELIGDFQTVIKPLGPLFSSIQGVSGSTILGNGDVGLILDVPTLIQLVTQRESLASKEAIL